MRRRARKGGGRQFEARIEGLGARGDGFASLDGRPVFVPFTVAGDRVRLRLTGTRAGGFKGEVLELLEEGPGRAEPPCPHFGVCGGCALQHLTDEAYARWKQGLVAQALARRGLGEVPVRPMIRIPPGTRRRATLAAARTETGVTLGFHGRESHAVVDVETCLLLTPRLMGLLPPLRQALSPLLQAREVAAVTLTETEDGPDLLVVSAQAPGLEAREALAAFAEGQDLARLSWAARAKAGEALAPEPVVLRRPPRLDFAGVAVEPPPGGFLQPTAAGEAALVEAVLSYLPEGAAALADLYAGCGTFTFPLARHARVHAVERDEAAMSALWSGARKAVTPSPTIFKASTSRPLSVSSRIASAGSSTAICKTSLRFFSPPEKPTLTARRSMSSEMPRVAVFWRTNLRKSMASSSSLPECSRCALRDSFKKFMVETPGISTGY